MVAKANFILRLPASVSLVQVHNMWYFRINMLWFSCMLCRTCPVEFKPLTDTFSCKVHSRLVWWVYVSFHAGLTIELR